MTAVTGEHKNAVEQYLKEQKILHDKKKREKDKLYQAKQKHGSIRVEDYNFQGHSVLGANFVHTEIQMNGTLVVDSIIASGLSLNEVVNNFNKAEITPTIKDLNEGIRNLNLESSGISSEQIPQYKQTLINFTNIRNDLLMMRIALKSLARETISRVDRLLKLIKLAKTNPKKVKIGLKLACKSMVNLIQRSQKILNEAEDYLRDVEKRLSTIDADLVTLSHKLEANSKKILQDIELMTVG